VTRKFRLGDVITIERGKTYKSALIGLDGPVLLGLGTIQRNGGFRSDSLRTYGGDSPEKMLVHPGQLYASLKDVTQSADLLGAVARLPHDGPVGRLTQDTVRLDIRAGTVPTDYLYWVLRTPQYRQYCRSHLTGTTNLGLPREDFLAFEFPAPTTDLLNLAETLGALDDKIESNRRAMELEFLLAVNVLTAGSTEAVRVAEVAAITKGLSYKGSGLNDGTTPGAVEMINLANFTTSGQMKAEGVKHYTGDFKPTHRLSELDLIVANTDLTQDREILGRGFLLPPRHVGAIHTHHTSVVRFQDGKKWMTPFLWARLQSPDFRDRAKGFATGTTVTALPVETLLDFEFTVPLEPEMISAKGNALIRHAWQLKDEAESLSRTRDALLPALLSGRIRDPEAKK
jgi:hypothetical protein